MSNELRRNCWSGAPLPLQRSQSRLPRPQHFRHGLSVTIEAGTLDTPGDTRTLGTLKRAQCITRADDAAAATDALATSSAVPTMMVWYGFTMVTAGESTV
jgi:hypothetical protein